ncbi:MULTISPECIES: tyrosine-type recombinase/integrase [Lactococcus]|uniref:Site-specific integrase n=1 Tax=Lactococcus formosensis TaxID=1281486 RepID=A0A9Q9D7P8_9LACT|nr:MULTISPECIES: site-specific integrase [Lactococcus]USJ21264.1 site-specific integrase [Lactococcus formosensis]WJE13743.1 site-specific integrase [Lactococcus petauri]
MRCYRRGKSWQYEISYTKGKNEVGKNIYSKKRKSGFSTKKAAEAAMIRDALTLCPGSVDIIEVGFGDYFAHWIELYKGNLSPHSKSTMRQVQKFIYEYMDNCPVGNITRHFYQDALNKYSLNHSESTLALFHRRIKECVEDLIFDGVIYENFAQRIKIQGQPKKSKFKENVCDDDSYFKLLNHVKNNIATKRSINTFVYIAMVTGMRYSEVAWLRWSDIDFKKKVIIVQPWAKRNLKTESSNRTIPISSETVKLLKIRKRWVIEQISKGELINEDNLVCSTKFGKAICNAPANRALKRLNKKLGISENITLHSLRHTFGSRLLYDGVNIVSVSRVLGHSGTVVTLRVYSHIIQGLEAQESDKIRQSMNY